MFDQSADKFNMCFPICYFSSLLKVLKVDPVRKKDSKFDVSSYFQISLLSCIEKILEKLMCNRICKFFKNKDHIYPLQFGF